MVAMLQQLSSSGGQQPALPGVRLFLNSSPELQRLSSLQGWAPWVSCTPPEGLAQAAAEGSWHEKQEETWSCMLHLCVKLLGIFYLHT